MLETLHILVTEENFSAINVLANNAGVLAGIATGLIVRIKNHYSRDQQIHIAQESIHQMKK